MFLTKKPNGVYYLIYSEEGKRKSISTKERIEKNAIRFVKEFQLRPPKRKDIDLIHLRLYYLRYSTTTHTYKTTKDIKYNLDNFIDFVGNKMASRLNREEINNYLIERTKISQYASAKSIAYLKMVFSYAKLNDLVETNPFEKIKKPKLPQRQPLFLSEAEFQSLLNVIDLEDYKDLVIFAVNTGMRRDELLNLRWNQVDLNRSLLVLDNHEHITKNRKVRTVSLNDKAIDVIKRRNREDEFVFMYKGEKYKSDLATKRFKKYIIKAGLNPKFKFHSLRHTFASWLVQKNTSIFLVSKLLGHSTSRVTEIYAHVLEEDLLKVVNTL